VVCEPKEGWQPPIEAFRLRKTCNDVNVPPLVLVNYEAATPPGRQYRRPVADSRTDLSESRLKRRQ
jgi:hypothetical protein